VARFLAPPNRGSYPRQFLANPYGRRVQLAGFGRLGDAGTDFAAAINSDPLSPAPSFNMTAAAAPAAAPAALPDYSQLNFAPGFGPDGTSTAPDAFAALTLQQDASYLPAVDAAATKASAVPSTPTPPSNSSIDWTKMITAASAGLITAGGSVASSAIKAKSAQQAAQAAQAAQQSAAARAAAMAKAGLKSASSPLGLEIIGGVAVLGLVLILALRK
jgi:hypothetical protein